MRILVAGGTGYIGSHSVLALQEAGHDVVVIDNLVNSSEESMRRVARISGKTPEFHPVDLVDEDAVERVFAARGIDAVIHFAAVGRPIPYEITARRAGDLPAFWADATSALADLSWSTTKTVDQMCEDHWRWQKNNPNGYAG